MSKIYVNFSEIRSSNCELPYLELRAGIIKKRMCRLKEEVPDYICEKYQIGQRLELLCKDIGELVERLDELYEVTKYCVEQYEEAEYENERNAGAFY